MNFQAANSPKKTIPKIAVSTEYYCENYKQIYIPLLFSLVINGCAWLHAVIDLEKGSPPRINILKGREKRGEKKV